MLLPVRRRGTWCRRGARSTCSSRTSTSWVSAACCAGHSSNRSRKAAGSSIPHGALLVSTLGRVTQVMNFVAANLRADDGRVSEKAAILPGPLADRLCDRALFAREGAGVGLIDRDPAASSGVKELANELPGAAIHWRKPTSPNIARSPAQSTIGRRARPARHPCQQCGGASLRPGRRLHARKLGGVLQTNVTGYAMCSRAALPYLRRSGSGQHRQRRFGVRHRRPREYGPIRCQQGRNPGIDACAGVRGSGPWHSRQRRLPGFDLDAVDLRARTKLVA